MMSAPPAVPLLAVRDLVVRYGNIEALHGISLSVERGRIVCLIGANGAGKSTLLRAISGLIPASAGSIAYVPRIGGDQPQAIHKWRAERIVAAGLSHVPEGRGVFGQMTVQENLSLGAYLRRDNEIHFDEERVFALFPRLRERRGQLAGTLSGGEQQMLAIGRSLMGKPHMLLLDEPSLGLAPLLVEQIFRVITTINREGTTVLLVEQNAQMALRTAHYAYVLETGKVALEGPAKNVADDPRVRKAYLGED